MPKVAVIILTWNGMKYLPDCLGSLINQDYEKVNREYIIVDNASSDGTVNYIKENFSEFSLIENDKNYGFDKGNNIGIKYALDKGYDYIVLLNQDTVVDPSWLSELVKAAESNKKIGAVQSLMLYWENANIRECDTRHEGGARSESTRTFKVNSCGNELHFLGFGFCGGNQKKLEIGNCKLEIISDITYASSSAVLYRANVLKEVGCFDE
ncbi:MAG: glycosyltransferase family 2 protein, partial [bacterium]